MVVDSASTRVLPPEFDRAYPVAVKGEGVWLEDSDGRRFWLYRETGAARWYLHGLFA